MDAYRILWEISSSHAVTVLSFTTKRDARYVSELRAMCDEVITVPVPASPGSWQYFSHTAKSFASRLPAIAAMCHSQKMVVTIRDLIAKKSFDLIHVEFTQMAHYVEYFRNIPALIDESDIAYLRRQRFTKTVKSYLKRKLLQWDTDKLKSYELGFCSRYKAILVRTEVDRHILKSAIPEATVEVIPPWVDLSFADRINTEAASNDVLFYGALWRPVNDQAARYFIRSIFPMLAAVIPDCRFVALGSRPSARLQSMVSDRVLVPGFVQDVSSFYLQSAVVVAPLLAGAGIKGKIIQALACGKPVVTTTIGAEGIPATDKDGLFIRDDPKEFAVCIAELLKAKRYLKFRNCTRDFVRRYYDWKKGMLHLECLYHKLAKISQSASIEVTNPIR